jgi:zinc protease
VRAPFPTTVAAALAISCAALPFRGESGIRPLSFDLWDVHCPSGLRVIVERAPGSQVAGVTTVVGAGSRQDPPGREGLAHLVEHLTFRAQAGDQAPLAYRLRHRRADVRRRARGGSQRAA